MPDYEKNIQSTFVEENSAGVFKSSAEVNQDIGELKEFLSEGHGYAELCDMIRIEHKELKVLNYL